MTTALPPNFPRNAHQSSVALAIVAFVLLVMAACTSEPEATKPKPHALSTARDEAPAAPVADAKPIPGDFDYWLVALSWSPTWCEFNPDNREQCGTRGFGFVLHGLWPQYERGGGPQDCRSRQRVSQNTIDRTMAFMPSRGLIIHEWRSHGSCTTLDPDDYFQLADRAFASVRIPQALRAPRTPPQLSARDVASAFVDANPGLSSDAIQVACTGNQLSEVRICTDANLSPRDCGKLSRSRCPAGILRIPSIR
ncbi:MAG: ribonuclease T2 [Dokdonella sp.]